MFNDIIKKAAETVVNKYKKAKKKIVTAESCTGGLVCGALTAVPGSSAVVEGGIITYSNEAKVDLLGVDPTVLKEHGAVSEDVAAYMAMGALEFTDGDISVAITGIAGPDGGSDEKPVGTVWFAVGVVNGDEIDIHTGKYLFDGDRDAIRAGAVETALTLLSEVLN